jgi:predicted AAA+ superfamily ATPase
LVLGEKTVIQRKLYMEKAGAFVDKPVIKVITGMRRSGKSVILALLREELLSRGTVRDDQILYLNFESRSLDSLTDGDALYRYVTSKVPKQGRGKARRLYIMLDEIQRVKDWERTVASFRVDLDCDIYITGSNANLLSGELHTLLAGRFVEIPVYPLSFGEYLDFTHAFKEDQGKDRATQFLDYLRHGGLPGIHEMGINTEAVFPYLQDIFNSVMLKDVITRRHIRDVELLERIVYFLMDNLGNIFSAKTVSDFLKNQGRRLSVETVYNYLGALEESYLIRKVNRYDIKGKRQLETQEKYYMEDQGIKHAVLGYRENDISGLLENVVFMELKRRGYAVHIGQLNKKEVDFIATRREEKLYIQVCYLLASNETVDREFGPLLEIQDQYPKLVLSLDKVWQYNRDGIVRKNVIDFLLGKQGRT